MSEVNSEKRRSMAERRRREEEYVRSLLELLTRACGARGFKCAS